VFAQDQVQARRSGPEDGVDGSPPSRRHQQFSCEAVVVALQVIGAVERGVPDLQFDGKAHALGEALPPALSTNPGVYTARLTQTDLEPGRRPAG
jgi:hypothetical protein